MYQPRIRNSWAAVVPLVLLLITLSGALEAIELHAIGRVESLYRNRASVKIIEMVGTPSADVSVGKGSWVSFELPKIQTKKRRRRKIQYGNIVVVELVGMAATEYEQDPDAAETDLETPDIHRDSKPGVVIWSASKVERVKDPSKYDTGIKKGRRGRRNRKRKKKEAPRIWTQEETVRGKVLLKKEKLYIKEKAVGRKDKGLYILSPEWAEKLKPYKGQKVVIHGTTHRVTVGSGTLDIRNLIRIYGK